MPKIKLTTTHKVTIAIGCIGALGTIGAAVWKSQPSNAQSGSIINNQGIVTQGQIGGTNTVINRQPARHIDDEFRRFVRANVSKNKQIKLMVLSGDPERDVFAAEIRAFLENEGYSVNSPTLSFLVGSGGVTPRGVEVGPESSPDTGTWVFKVGVNTR